MKVNYQQAVVSLCVDLTNPDGASRPVAVLLVAKVEDIPLAGIACRPLYEKSLDPITREILGDVPQLLVRHLNKAFTRTAGLQQVLDTLHASLRNSLHVSEILPADTMKVKEPDELFPELVRILTKTIHQIEGTSPARMKGKKLFRRVRRPIADEEEAPVEHRPLFDPAATSVWAPHGGADAPFA